MLLQDAREQVRRSARRERHHDGDGPLRPSLLRVCRCCQRNRGGNRKGCENSTHANPPAVRFLPSSAEVGYIRTRSTYERPNLGKPTFGCKAAIHNHELWNMGPRNGGPRDAGVAGCPARGGQMYVRVNRDSHRLEMGIAALVEVLVGVAHGLGLAASEHDLEVDRLEAVVLIAVDDAGGTRDAFPGPETGGEALAALVLDKDVEIALEHEETLFDLVGVGGIALSRLHIHDRQGEVLRRDDARIAVLAGTARADEAVLCALVALDLGVLERRPIRLLLAEASDIFLHDVLDRNIDQFRRTRMPCNAHGSLLSNGIVGIESIPALRRQSMKPPVRLAIQTGRHLRAACASSQMRVGVSGSSRGCAPKPLNAFATALAITPPAAMMPPSPAPFAPNGLIGEG